MTDRPPPTPTISAQVPRNVVLVGMMGSGKSAAGRLLAQRLDRELVDLDALVEEGAQASVAEIFAAEGEAGFRRRETAVVSSVAQRQGLVVACGGGVVLDPANVAALRASGTMIWLQVSPAVAAERLGEDRGRPLLAAATGNLAQRLGALSTERAAAYQAAADLVVDGDGPLSEVVERLARLLEPAHAGPQTIASVGTRP